MQNEIALNVFGEPLIPCSFDPLTGFFRDGCCKTNEEDVGSHLVCAIVTDAFLQFSLQKGNDLITPRPEYRFPGLLAGDQWCLCINRWVEGEDRQLSPDPAKCIGSACMAWRRRRWFLWPAWTVGEQMRRAKIGFCGLAGKQ